MGFEQFKRAKSMMLVFYQGGRSSYQVFELLQTMAKFSLLWSWLNLPLNYPQLHSMSPKLGGMWPSDFRAPLAKGRFLRVFPVNMAQHGGKSGLQGSMDSLELRLFHVRPAPAHLRKTQFYVLWWFDVSAVVVGWRLSVMGSG